MTDRLKIAVIQHDIVNGDKEENILTAVAKMNEVEKDCDIIVFPELFSTGFISNTEQMKSFAELNSGITMDIMHKYAREFNMAICGSFIAKTGQNFYNRAFFIEPSGEECFYDKHHLFSVSEESRVFTSGNNQLPIVRFRGWNLSMAICYDLRFPVWCRNVDNKYDVLFVVANWPHSRVTAWKQLLIGRAIENQSFVIGANRKGNDEYGEYPGDSFVIDYLGRAVGRYTDTNILYAEITKEGLDSFRKKFPVWKNADRFEFY